MRLLRNLFVCAALAAASGCSGDDAGGNSGTDAGLAEDGGGAGNGSSGQGGGGTGTDAGGRDSGFGIDGSIVGLACRMDSDCGDADVYQCVNEVCVARRLPSGVWQSGGGGITKSEQFEMRISVGAPAPMGTASSDRFQITIGAGAGRP